MRIARGRGGTMQAAGPGGEIVETLLSTTYYYYYYWDRYEEANVDDGNVTRVVTEKGNVLPSESRFEATQMVYARNGRAMTYGLAASFCGVSPWHRLGGAQSRTEQKGVEQDPTRAFEVAAEEGVGGKEDDLAVAHALHRGVGGVGPALAPLGPKQT